MDYLSKLFPQLFSYSHAASFVNTLRIKRHQQFLKFLHEAPSVSTSVNILDIGGTYNYWETVGLLDYSKYHIVLLNLNAEILSDHIKGFSSVMGNATCLDYPDNYFDIVFSNSVIEHAGSRDAQTFMAKEIRRVGRSYYVQSPSKWFPLEPHCRIPFFQFLPKHLRAMFIYMFNINYFPSKPTYMECVKVADTTIMLSQRDFKSLFPESEIIVEKLLGMTKSYTAIYLEKEY